MYLKAAQLAEAMQTAAIPGQPDAHSPSSDSEIGISHGTSPSMRPWAETSQSLVREAALHTCTSSPEEEGREFRKLAREQPGNVPGSRIARQLLSLLPLCFLAAASCSLAPV